jgi:hypothetical protein
MASTIAAGTTSGTAIAIAGDTSGVLQFQTNGTTAAVTIDTSQNVGIGTTSPLVPSSGRKVVTLNGTTDAMYNIGVNGTYTGFFYSSASNTQLGSATSIPLQFYTGDVERMRIDSSGNLLLGGTGTGGNLTISGKGSEGWAVKMLTPINSGTYNFINFCLSNTNQVGSIQSNGSTTSYNTSSDYRLKENIAPMTGALAKVAQLKPVTYDWKAGGSSQGFIAHELQAVVPDAVTGEKDAVDADGNIKPQGIDTSFLVATLTAAIQELNAKVDAQAVRIAELEGAK